VLYQLSYVGGCRPGPAGGLNRSGAILPGVAALRDVPVELPQGSDHPGAKIARRVAFAFGLIVFVALVAYLDRDGYADSDGTPLSLLDAFYYSTVSVTTTGYGDIRPESETSRLLTTLLVTPARVLFLIVLVGTTLEVLAERTRATYRLTRWRRRLRDHVIIAGFGTKGRAAAQTLVDRGRVPAEIVVVDERPGAREQAAERGFAAVAGSAASSDVLQAAGIGVAEDVVVAVDRDDTAVLVTLTARELNPDVTIAAAVREEENAHLLKHSGADSVIVSSGAAGRLLGFACQSPHLVEALEDLMSIGQGLDLEEHFVGPGEAGPLASLDLDGPVIGVVRDGRLLRFDDPEARELKPGDRVLRLRSVRSADAA
jgi:voltage-gated potassium channel